MLGTSGFGLVVTEKECKSGLASVQAAEYGQAGGVPGCFNRARARAGAGAGAGAGARAVVVAVAASVRIKW